MLAIHDTRLNEVDERLAFIRQEIIRRGEVADDYKELKRRVRFLEQSFGSQRSPQHDFRGVR